MRTTQIKILLSISVLCLLVFFLWKSCSTPTKPPDKTYSTTSNYVDSFISSIDSLAVDDICSPLYQNCMAAIKDWSSTTGGAGNKMWLVKLNGQYGAKMCAQAKYYFGSGNCDVNKLKCLRARLNDVKSSGELDPNEQMYQKLEEVTRQIQQFEALDNFIAISSQFSYQGTGNINDTFPIANVMQILTVIDSFEKISIISRCQRLTIAINSLRNNLFQKHIAYLMKKINTNGGKYKDMTISDYKNNIVSPLTTEVDNLDNSIYKLEPTFFGQKQGDLVSTNSNYQLSAFQFYRQNSSFQIPLRGD